MNDIKKSIISIGNTLKKLAKRSANAKKGISSKNNMELILLLKQNSFLRNEVFIFEL